MKKILEARRGEASNWMGTGSSVMRQRFVFCLIVSVNVVLPVSFGVSPGSLAHAADECLAARNAEAADGMHWYYRTDRATKRKCWFLAEEGKPHAAVRVQ